MTKLKSPAEMTKSMDTAPTSLGDGQETNIDRLEATLNEDSFLKVFAQRIRWKRILQVIMDSALVATGFAAAYLIRFDGHVTELYLRQLTTLVPSVVLLQLVSNWTLGVYRRLWRYTGLTEVMELGLSVLCVTTLILIARALGWLAVENNHLSYGIIFVNGGVAFLSLTGPRVLRRLMTEHSQRRHWRQPVRKRVLVVGAGDAGQMVLRELKLRSDLGVDVVGLIDDDPAKLRKRIGSLTVFGTTAELPRFIENLFIDQVIIAMPSAPPSETRRIVEMCREAEVETRILPGLFELIDGKVSINQLREVSLEDLLGRDPVSLDTDSISGYLAGRSVLVTGAGGSIGSELSRQIMRFKPSRLILLGKGENSIFSIQQELVRNTTGVDIVSVIADVRDAVRMKTIFDQHKPQVVFHAAAHKHVPLMESNVAEAVANNVFGTKCVAELSAATGVKTFVLVSSDKAVNPTSVMGATKRTAELVIQDLAQLTDTKYVAVRFGNVLASRGSVIPLWKQQISQGGPITVTHPEATRYFMLIPEAVQLILQAGALGAGGEIFVLDMGNPVKILDLANDLIRFSGLSPGVDIEVEFIGLRPGEKLYEELLTEEEGLTKTVYEKIFVGQPQPIDRNGLKNVMDRLKAGATAGDDGGLRQELDKLVGGCLKQKTDV
ncbi:MAG: polysaccharide biosynthesis protein [Candidatus Obscuribacterales bacterium]|nr:polysaccharide biosynthesis protein [Candidatus Obscuribacterales bacterium]